MSYETLILMALMLVFCVTMQIITIKALFSMFNSARPEGAREIKPTKFIERKPKKSKTDRNAEKKAAEEQRKMEIIMRNIDAYDGTGIGQEEVR